MRGIKGYKAFNSDMTCRDMKYEVGKEYKMNKKPVLCETGYHFCKSIADCYNFYDMNVDTIICEIRALGEVVSDDNKIKFCTNHILIVKKVSNPKEKSNISASSSGYCNSGNRNSGNDNSGYCNSGNNNSGYFNSGNDNSGSGNTGSRNIGNFNSGNNNSGNGNSGDQNIGNYNTGDRNSGYYNTGDWNTGDWSNGMFCTEKDPKIKLFDKESDWTIYNWLRSKARSLLKSCPYSYSKFVNSNDMIEKEKELHPEYKTIGGYIKTIVVTDEDKQKWWDSLSDEDKNTIYELPNFDAKIFKECTGITVQRDTDKEEA